MSDKPDTDFDTAWDAVDEPESQPPADAEQGRSEDDTDPDDEAPVGDEGKPSDPTPDAAAPPAEADEISDEFAGLPAEVRGRLEALKAEVESERSLRSKAENTIRSHEGRASRAERELNQLRLQIAATAPKEEPKPAEVSTVSDAELDAVVEEYGDIGKPLVAAHRALQAKVDQLSQAATAAEKAKQAEAERDLQSFLDQQATTLTEAHPDWSETVKTQAYADWAVAQPGWLKDLILRNGNQLVDGEAAVEVFSRFKADTKTADDPEAERRRLQLEASRHIPNRAPALEPTGKGVGDYDSEWEAAEAEDKRRKARA